MSLTYLFSFIDKVALSEASIFGIQDDDVSHLRSVLTISIVTSEHRIWLDRIIAGSIQSFTSVTWLPNTQVPSQCKNFPSEGI